MKKTVLITGASRGIGKATAVAFAKQGWNVAINYLKSNAKTAALVTALEENETNAFAYQADVSDINQVRQMVGSVMMRFGRIDVLVNNAGIAQQKLFSDITEEEWDRMFGVNVKGTYFCTQAVIPDISWMTSRGISPDCFNLLAL
ncbi:MAG: SDR family oxidoreductase [Clostridiales bacterium]|nr:SDR family oxidoreductase [Clostridiales bacterium]